MSSQANRRMVRVFDTNLDVITWSDAQKKVMQWAAERESKYACFCNVHVVVTARRDNQLRSALDSADLIVCDGAPVAWMVRQLQVVEQSRIDGPGFMLSVCSAAER